MATIEFKFSLNESISGKDVDCRVVRNALVPTTSFAPHQINGSKQDGCQGHYLWIWYWLWQPRSSSFTSHMMQRENRCAKCVRFQISEVEVKLSTEHLSLNATNTGPNCVKYHQENIFTWHHWNKKFSPRHANFAPCMLSETLVKHCNDALFMSFICYQTLECDKASNFSERIS